MEIYWLPLLLTTIISQVILLCNTQDEAGFIGTLLSEVINFSKAMTRKFPRYPSANKDGPPGEEFDFIIIGAGPSGAAIANRLSENPRWKVLLLEAGEEGSFMTEIPCLATGMQFSKYDWGYNAEKQDHFCRGCINNRLDWPHGIGLGGTTLIHLMINVRGNRRDYDKWAELGNPGWSFNEVLPYFLKSEDARIAIADPGYHQTGGYLRTGDIKFRTKIITDIINAAQQAGYPYVDYNGKEQLGVSYVQADTKNGRRLSAERAFLRPIRHRKNLVIRTNALVSKIVIDPVSKTTTGVEYIKNNQTLSVNVRKEVIISAGGLNSPQLLMLSGVGPKSHLEELGIPVIQNLPVGQKMIDHATFPFLGFTINASRHLDFVNEVRNPRNYIEYISKGRGLFTSIGVEGLLYMKTKESDDPDPQYPDMEVIIVGTALQDDLGIIFRRFFNIPRKIYDIVWKPYENQPMFMTLPMLVHPKSIGYIKLSSKNPTDAPKFYANFFSDPQNKDIKTFIAAIREIQRIVESPALQQYGAKLIDIPLPGCKKETFNSDEYWECSLRYIIGSLYHQVATCKMGPAGDDEAVVDNRLRVYGVRNLRVADTSIIPFGLTAHTAEPAYMVGEKAADLIKEDWI